MNSHNLLKMIKIIVKIHLLNKLPLKFNSLQLLLSMFMERKQWAFRSITAKDILCLHKKSSRKFSFSICLFLPDIS